MAYVWFKVSNLITPIRVSEEVELEGLDVPEMGALAYPDSRHHSHADRPHAGGARGGGLRPLPALTPSANEGPAASAVGPSSFVGSRVKSGTISRSISGLQAEILGDVLLVRLERAAADLEQLGVAPQALDDVLAQ